MKKIEINKCNWSGEKGEVILYADGKTFKMLDYKFILKPNLTKKQEEEYGVLTDYEVYSADGEWSDDYSLCRVYNMEICGKRQFIGSSYGLERENEEDPRIAAALVLFNTI